MSLIVARKEGNQVIIVGDTKLTHPNHDLKGSKENPDEGTIKTIILSDTLCVSFAGETETAANAFSEIGNNTNREEIITLLEKYHRDSDGKTEFIVCSGNPQPFIYKMKNGECKEVQTSWIGDQKAFESFQGFMMGAKKKTSPHLNTKHQSGINLGGMMVSFDINATVEVKGELFSKMSDAMDEVIIDSAVSSVGGFKVGVVYDGKFRYVQYVRMYHTDIHLQGSGAHILGHGSAQSGAYSINFMGGSDDHMNLAVHVKQGRFGVLYSRKTGELMNAKVYPLDEVDFMDLLNDKYQMDKGLITQDRVHKYTEDGLGFFADKKYVEAKAVFEKALPLASGKQKADLFLHLGTTFLNLRQNEEARNAFQQAVNIDPRYHALVIQILNQPFTNPKK